MTRSLLLSAFSLTLLLGLQTEGAAQVAPRQNSLASLQSAPAATTAPALRPGRSRPVLRTLGTVLASAAAFHYVESQSTGDPNDLRRPIAAAAAASAATAWIFSDAPTARVLLGSVLSALPAGAAAYFAAGSLPDAEHGQIPMLVFSVPHGLLTSAFAKTNAR